MISRFTNRGDLCIYGGSRGQNDTFAWGNGVSRDLWPYGFRLSFHDGGAAVAISPVLQ